MLISFCVCAGCKWTIIYIHIYIYIKYISLWFSFNALYLINFWWLFRGGEFFIFFSLFATICRWHIFWHLFLGFLVQHAHTHTCTHTHTHKLHSVCPHIKVHLSLMHWRCTVVPYRTRNSDSGLSVHSELGAGWCGDHVRDHGANYYCYSPLNESRC